MTVMERESCLWVHELESKWCPQPGMAEARNVARVMLLNVISAMNIWSDHWFKNGYFLNCLIIIYREILCHDISVNKDPRVL